MELRIRRMKHFMPRLAAACMLGHGLFVGASAQWTVVNLHPAGMSGSRGYAVKGGQQVGSAGVGGAGHASIWNGTAISWLDINPVGASQSTAYATDGGVQAGEAMIGSVFHAGIWSGTAGTWTDLNPSAATESHLFASSGSQQGGSALILGINHASLWSGTAGSWLDVHPGAASHSFVYGMSDGGQQVGLAIIGGQNHASVWNGTAASWVDLQPTGWTSSIAYGVSGGQQVGFAKLTTTNFHAGMWSGTGPSWFDLNPPTGVSSIAYGIDGGQQVGLVSFGFGARAVIWNGTPGSCVNLGALLPANYSTSEARGIRHEGGFTYVTGYGFNNTLSRLEAILWIAPDDVGGLLDFIVMLGKRVSGAISELSNSDDQYLRLNALQSTGGRKLNTEVVVGVHANRANPGTLRVKLESHVSPTASNGEIALKNWSSGQFDTVQSFTLLTSDNLVTTSGIVATPYVRADGRIEVRVRSIGAGQVSIDQVRVELTP